MLSCFGVQILYLSNYVSFNANNLKDVDINNLKMTILYLTNN